MNESAALAAAAAPTDGTPVVALRRAGKVFGSGTVALDRLDLEVRRGEFLTLLGPSGCGKSTALRLIAGLSEPSSGAIAWPDSRGARRRRDRLRVPGADPDAVGDGLGNVCLPLRLASIAERDARRRGSRRRSRASGSPTSRDAYPRELSGGMKMRVSIARALVTRAEAPADGRAVRGARRDHALQAQQRSPDAVAARSATTVVFVTHSVFELVYLSSRIVVMTKRPGRVFTELAIDAPCSATRRFRTSARICGALPARLRGPRRRDAAPRGMGDCMR